MKKRISTFVLAAIAVPLYAPDSLISSSSSSNQPDPVMAQPVFIDRSQATRQYRNMLFPTARKHPDINSFWFDLWVMPGGYGTFNNQEFGRYFSFADSNDGEFVVGSITAPNSDFAAAQLGLPLNYTPHNFKFKPVIHQFVINTGLTLGLDPILDGLYLAIYAPIAWAHYRLKFKSLDENGGEVIEAFKGGSHTVSGAAGQTIPSWNYGRLGHPKNGTQCSEWGVSDAIADLGWHFVNNEHEQLGARLRIIIPSGDTPNMSLWFPPRIGMNRWGVGAGLDGNIVVWERDAVNEVSIWVDAYYSFLFPRIERRSYDLCNKGRGSRYMLLKEFNDDGTFKSFVNGINALTLESSSSFHWQVEGTILINLTFDEWTINVGYNIYGRGQETLCFAGQQIPTGRFGIAGSNREINSTTQSNAVLAFEGTNDAAPVFITNDDLDRANAAIPRTVQHTFFLYVNRVWEDFDFPPYVGIGAEASFSSDHTGIDQGGIFVRGGIYYS